jgi:hypothetical protein
VLRRGREGKLGLLASSQRKAAPTRNCAPLLRSKRDGLGDRSACRSSLVLRRGREGKLGLLASSQREAAPTRNCASTIRNKELRAGD